MMRASIVTSMLPPESTSDDRAAARGRARRLSSAASGAAPAPSTTVFSISSEQEDRVGQLLLVDGDDVVDVALRERERALAAPAAPRCRRRSSARAEHATALARRPAPARIAGTRVGLHADDAARRAGAPSPRRRRPPTRPPPPTGTTTASRSGTCSSSSRPIVPWPAMTRASSNGCTNTAAALGARSPRARVVRLVVVRRRTGSPRRRRGARTVTLMSGAHSASR